MTHPRAHRTLFALTALALLLAGELPAAAGERTASMVIDANSGKILHNQSGDELRHPASLTKMMTIYLAFEAIDAGRTSFDTRIPISARAAAQPPSKLGLEAGSEIALGDAIRALIVKSANDMAVAVAEHLGGSEPKFAKLMTQRAHEMGMSKTIFRNASGLPNDAQVTTARDMLTLALRLSDTFPKHYELFATTTFTYGGKTHRTHNSLVRRFPGIDGIKTGYTRSSGFNLVSSYRAGGKHLVAAVFGGVSAGARDAYMRLLLFQSLEKAATTRTRPQGPVLVAAARPAKQKAAAPSVAASPAPSVPVPLRKPEPPANNALASDEAAKDAAPEPTESPAQATITVAKVRTVSVLDPGPDTGSLPAEAARQSSAPPADAKPGFDFAALRQTLAESAAEGPRKEAHPGRIASADAAAGFGLAEPQETATQPAASPTPDIASPTTAPAPQSEDTVRPGRPPSTLGAQLATLAAAAPEKREAAPPPPSAPTGYQIQIGAFRSAAEAEAAMKTAATHANEALAGSQPVTMPVPAGNTTLYRARFAGFDAQGASRACAALRRHSIDCFVAAQP